MSEAFLTGPTHINLSLEGDGSQSVQYRFVVYNLYAVLYNLLFQSGTTNVFTSSTSFFLTAFLSSVKVLIPPF